jgi:predicted acyltransferase
MSNNTSMQRMISLDFFRGITIAAMILVNFAGDWEHIYIPLEHAAWNGLTPTDLIFPFFLFVVGISIVFAYTKRMATGAKPRSLYKKIITRSIKIFVVGLFLALYPHFNFGEMRIAGVLQRIAIVFLICSLLFLHTNWKIQSILGIAILIVYWLAMTLIPTPGYDKVMFEPGVNLAAYIDSILLPGRMWNGTWDPEGIFSTLPAIATGISGLLVGKLLTMKLETERKIIWLFTAGFVVFLSGIIWSWNFPLNKNLWTSSYVLFTSGLASMTLAVLIFFIDVLEYKKIAQFGIIYGSNAITVYVLADLLAPIFYEINIGGKSLNVHFTSLFNGIGFSPEFSSMVFSIAYVALNFIPVWILYRKKIFIKL